MPRPGSALRPFQNLLNPQAVWEVDEPELSDLEKPSASGKAAPKSSRESPMLVAALKSSHNQPLPASLAAASSLWWEELSVSPAVSAECSQPPGDPLVSRTPTAWGLALCSACFDFP